MPRDYRIERDGVIRRWYGENHQAGRRGKSRRDSPITPTDCYGIPAPMNAPFLLAGHCLAWKHGLNRDGYGTLSIDGKEKLAHRIVFAQTRGQIPEGFQVNHLCNRPYCLQPAHLYAGSQQDNSDDARLFDSQDRVHTAQMMWWPQSKTDDPLLQRLRKSNRYDFLEAWEPVEWPPQIPLEEFTCPGHDFSIPMFGGEHKICRICEVTEFQEEESDNSGLYSLIASLCPASQSIGPIWEKIVTSDFASESYRDMRRKAYYRSREGMGMGDHDLRKCSCVYCGQDRRDFRAGIEPQLNRVEIAILEVCDRLEPQISAAFEEASVVMMGALARKLGMDDDKARILEGHGKKCSIDEMVKGSRVLERDLAYLLHALAEVGTRDEMLKDKMAQLIVSRWSTVRSWKGKDDTNTLESIVVAAAGIASRLAETWAKEANDLLGAQVEAKRGFYDDVWWFAEMLARKDIFEHMRFELLGRNTWTDEWPHPHDGCADGIMRTGQVETCPQRMFEVGKGYLPTTR